MTVDQIEPPIHKNFTELYLFHIILFKFGTQIQDFHLSELFYVRNHHPVPNIDPEDYELQVLKSYRVLSFVQNPP